MPKQKKNLKEFITKWIDLLEKNKNKASKYRAIDIALLKNGKDKKVTNLSEHTVISGIVSVLGYRREDKEYNNLVGILYRVALMDRAKNRSYDPAIKHLKTVLYGL